MRNVTVCSRVLGPLCVSWKFREARSSHSYSPFALEYVPLQVTLLHPLVNTPHNHLHSVMWRSWRAEAELKACKLIMSINKCTPYGDNTPYKHSTFSLQQSGLTPIWLTTCYNAGSNLHYRTVLSRPWHLGRQLLEESRFWCNASSWLSERVGHQDGLGWTRPRTRWTYE